MNDRDVADLLERAAGSGDLPSNFTERTISRARSRRRRHAAVAVGALTAVVAAGIGLFTPVASDFIGREPDANAVASAVDPALMQKLSDDVHEPITADQVIATATAGEETIVVVRGTPHAAEAAGGGKRARIFIAPRGGKFYTASDYLSHEFVCYTGDAVCEATQASGLGLFFVRPQAEGRTFVLVVTPAGRQVEVVAQGRAHHVDDAARGAVVEVPHVGVNPDVSVWVRLPDGRRYRMAEAPGATITTQPVK